jgi:hypothetical protein
MQAAAQASQQQSELMAQQRVDAEIEAARECVDRLAARKELIIRRRSVI